MLRRPAIVVLAWLAMWPVSATGASGPDLDTELARLAPIRGPAVTAATLEGRVVLVTFFASWCPPCREEFAHLNALRDAYGDAGLTVVAINVFETYDGLSTPAKLKRFLDETGPKFAVLKGDRVTGRLSSTSFEFPAWFCSVVTAGSPWCSSTCGAQPRPTSAKPSYVPRSSPCFRT
jgi:thiol-disulfide isomerase/thioredoxin